MRLRMIGALVAAVLATTGLAGCRTNVGTAATIDGHRITESDVSGYITPDAKPVSLQNQDQSTSQISPKSFVVRELIYDRLFLKIFAMIPNAPSAAKIDAELDNERKGKTYTQQAEKLGLKGYTEDFYKIVLRAQLLQGGLTSEQQSGVDVNAIVRKLHFPVTVNPRFGNWQSKQFSFDGNAAIPSYLSAQPGAGGAAPPSQPTA